MGLMDKIADVSEKLVSHDHNFDPAQALAEESAHQKELAENERILEEGVEVPGPPLAAIMDADADAKA